MRRNDETTQLIWVQKKFKKYREQIRTLIHEKENLEKSSEILNGKDWFILPGPKFDENKDTINLFTLHTNAAHPICSLGKNDLLLIGRNRTEFRNEKLEEQKQELEKEIDKYVQSSEKTDI